MMIFQRLVREEDIWWLHRTAYAIFSFFYKKKKKKKKNQFCHVKERASNAFPHKFFLRQ
jgi:hypothetical protein